MIVRSDRAAYRILPSGSFFGPDCHLYQEGDAFYFDGIPNEDMEPLNDIATQRLRAYIEQLEAGERAVAEKNGRHYGSRTRSIEERLAMANTDARQLQLTQNGPGVPIMGGKRDTTSIEKMEPDSTPETGRRGPGRPRKTEQIATIS